MAKLLYADGRTKEVQPRNGKKFSIKEMQGHIGGYVEIVAATKKGYILIVNEDAKLCGLPINRQATLEAHIWVGDCIAGDALLCKRSEVTF